MNKIFYLLSIIFALVLHSCEMIEYHPYDGRVTGETDINNKNIARIEKACRNKESIRFVVASDTQRWYDETEDFVNSVNSLSNIDFVIHGGDVSDFGLTREFLWQRDILNRLHVPYVVLLGNHDCLANGVEVFQRVFGDINFSFIAGRTKFVCLNTNALEFNYSFSVPDFEFIEKELVSSKDKYDKTVVAMHARPFSEQFNNNVANVFQRYIKEFPNLQFCLNGHDHRLTADNLFEDGIMYYGSPNIKKRTYLIFTLLPDNTYKYETVEF